MSWIWSVAIRRNSNRNLANCLPLCTTCMGWILIHNFDSFQIFCRRVTSRSWILKPSISNMSRHIAGQVPQLTLHKTSIYIYIAYRDSEMLIYVWGWFWIDMFAELSMRAKVLWCYREPGVADANNTGVARVCNAQHAIFPPHIFLAHYFYLRQEPSDISCT